MRPRPTVRLRLTAAYAGLVVGTTVVLLAVSFWLMRAQLHRTLPADEARSLSGRCWRSASAGSSPVAS